jgi:serine phosphatase RsbU (regulator of sigma subunit)
VGRIDALYISLAEAPVSEEWRSLLKLIASTYEQAEVVWEMRRQVRASAFVEHELETARNVQHRLMPLDAHFQNLEIVMGYEPCLWVGGDYVDAVSLPGGRVLLVIADVCGKGMQGALVTSSLHTLVRATVEGGEELPMLMSRMNRYLSGHLPEDSFVTLAAVALDPQTGLIECINAGHLPVLIARPDGDVRALQSASNLALGMLEEVPFVPEYSQLGADEVLLMYTDGLVELMDADRQPLGPERFREGVGRTVALSDGGPVNALDKALRSMIEDHRRARLPTDDAAFLIARRAPSAERQRALRWSSDELCRQTIH